MPKEKEKSKEWPRVLVAAPTSIRHAYCVDDWVKSIREWDYPKDRINIMVVDNTPFEYDKNEEFYAHLKNLGITVLRVPWERNSMAVVQMLGICRELYRQFAWLERYDYLFHLDTDTTIESKGLKKLVLRNKDQIGLPVHVYPKEAKVQPPCVFKTLGINPKKGLDYYTWPELNRIRENLRRKGRAQIYKVAAAPLGVLLVKRKVFSQVPFTVHDTLIMGEDIWYHNNSSAKGFEFWIDFTVKVNHNNTNWELAQAKDRYIQKIWVVGGYENAKKAVVIDHGSKTRKEYHLG